MKCTVKWESVIRISTSILLQQPYHFHGRYVHKDYVNMCTIYVCKDILNHTSMQAAQPQTYICMENWLVTALLTTPALTFMLVLNWLWVVSNFHCLKWSLKHAPDICPNQCRKLCILIVRHFVQRTKISFLYLLKLIHVQQTKVAFFLRICKVIESNVIFYWRFAL